jgi:hypothetical protein
MSVDDPVSVGYAVLEGGRVYTAHCLIADPVAGDGQPVLDEIKRRLRDHLGGLLSKLRHPGDDARIEELVDVEDIESTHEELTALLGRRRIPEAGWPPATVLWIDTLEDPSVSFDAKVRAAVASAGWPTSEEA